MDRGIHSREIADFEPRSGLLGMELGTDELEELKVLLQGAKSDKLRTLSDFLPENTAHVVWSPQGGTEVDETLGTSTEKSILDGLPPDIIGVSLMMRVYEKVRTQLASEEVLVPEKPIFEFISIATGGNPEDSKNFFKKAVDNQIGRYIVRVESVRLRTGEHVGFFPESYELSYDPEKGEKVRLIMEARKRLAGIDDQGVIKELKIFKQRIGE